MRRFNGVIFIAAISLALALVVTGCGVRQLPTGPNNSNPAGHDTTITTVHDTCATVVTSRRTFNLNNFTLGSPGTKQTLFEGTTVCDETRFMFITQIQYVGADGNTPSPLSVWIRDVNNRYTAIPCTWNGTSRTSLQLPNANGTYVDTAYVDLEVDRDFPSGTAVTAYILWGAAGSPSMAQPAAVTSPNAVEWHYEGSGTVTKTCLADSCWSDTTRTIVHRP